MGCGVSRDEGGEGFVAKSQQSTEHASTVKTTPPDDPQLRRLLHEWQPDSALPPRFQEAVWRRIERADTAPVHPPWNRWESIVGQWLQPKWAMAGLLAVVLLGGLSGFTAGADRAQSVAQGRYVAAVDPFQKGH